MSLIDYSTKLKEFGTTIEAWCASELVGLCVCYFNNFETRTAYISHIAINPNHKRSGIGRKLINLTRNIAKSKGFSSIRLEVKENNNIAIAFYRNMGFELLNTNGNKLLMELKCFSV